MSRVKIIGNVKPGVIAEFEPWQESHLVEAWLREGTSATVALEVGAGESWQHVATATIAGADWMDIGDAVAGVDEKIRVRLLEGDGMIQCRTRASRPVTYRKSVTGELIFIGPEGETFESIRNYTFATLPAAGTLTGAEQIEVVQAGASRRTTLAAAVSAGADARYLKADQASLELADSNPTDPDSRKLRVIADQGGWTTLEATHGSTPRLKLSAEQVSLPGPSYTYVGPSTLQEHLDDKVSLDGVGEVITGSKIIQTSGELATQIGLTSRSGTTNAYGNRIETTNAAAFWNLNASNEFSLLFSDVGNPNGRSNSLRPIRVNAATGVCSFAHGVTAPTMPVGTSTSDVATTSFVAQRGTQFFGFVGGLSSSRAIGLNEAGRLLQIQGHNLTFTLPSAPIANGTTFIFYNPSTSNISYVARADVATELLTVSGATYIAGVEGVVTVGPQSMLYVTRSGSGWYCVLLVMTAGNTNGAAVANQLSTARSINGTSFDGSANITTANWGTARNFTLGNSTKSVNGSANVGWTHAEMGVDSSATVDSKIAAAVFASGSTPTWQLVWSGTAYSVMASSFTGGALPGLYLVESNTDYGAVSVVVGFHTALNSTGRGGCVYGVAGGLLLSASASVEGNGEFVLRNNMYSFAGGVATLHGSSGPLQITRIYRLV